MLALMKTVRSSSRTCSARFVPGQNQLLANLSLLLFLRIFRSFVFMILKRTFEECVSLFSYQCSLLSQTALIFYHVVLTLSRTFLTFFKKFFRSFSTLSQATLTSYHKFFSMSTTFFQKFFIERRRRDLNPRAATNDLLPFQGSPFSHLGTSPKA